MNQDDIYVEDIMDEFEKEQCSEGNKALVLVTTITENAVVSSFSVRVDDVEVFNSINTRQALDDYNKR